MITVEKETVYLSDHYLCAQCWVGPLILGGEDSGGMEPSSLDLTSFLFVFSLITVFLNFPWLAIAVMELVS